MYWRNMKIKIIVGLMVLGLIGFVILIIVKTSQNKSSWFDNKRRTRVKICKYFITLKTNY